MSTTATQAPSRLPLDQIVDRGGNPRGDVDKASDEFRELVASIQLNGIVQPILVAQPDGDDGLYPLIAGHRRFAAAAEAGLTDAPVLVAGYAHDSTEAKIAAIAENVNRLNLSPLQEARGLEDLRATGMNQKQAAAAFGKSERWARDAELLLKLPKATADAFDRGALAVASTRPIQQVAEKSPRMAELLAQLAIPAAEKDGPQFATKGAVAGEVARLVNGALDPEKDGSSPVGCLVDAESAIDYDDCVLAGISHELLREFKPRFEALDKRIDTPGYYGPGPQPELLPTDIDEARAFGCLLELEGFNRFREPITDRYITDTKWLADRIPDALDRAEAARLEKVQASKLSPGAAARQASGAKKTQPSAAEREARKKAREAEAQRKEEARTANLELGQRVRHTYQAPAPTLDEAKAIAAMALYYQCNSIAGAIAYADRELREDDPKNPGEFIYANGFDIEKKIWDAIEAAKSPEQVWGVLLGVMATAAYTDPTVERLESRESKWEIPGEGRGNEDTPLGKLAARIRSSALARKVVPDSVLKRQKQKDDAAKAARKREEDAARGKVLQALAAGKKPKTPGEIAGRGPAKKEVWQSYISLTQVRAVLAKEVKAKRVDVEGEGSKAKYSINPRGRKELEKLQAAERKAQEAGLV